MAEGREFKPRVLGFLCNWCCYAGADLAGVSRYQYPPIMRVVRLMCSGRVDPAFVIRAFVDGYDGVFIGGCWLGECHYNTEGNHDALVMTHLTRMLLGRSGVDPRRLRLEWVSASEGIRFAEVMQDFTRQLKELGPLGASEGTGAEERELTLEAARRIVPYVKLVERERLRVRFRTQEEYAAFFAADETRRLLGELVEDRLAVSQIMLLLRAQPLPAGEIARALGMRPAEVTRHLVGSSRQGLVKYDDGRKCFALA